MNRILSATLKGLVVFCALFTSIAFASDKLAAVNAEVEKKAEEIDQKYGVLLTTQELNDLKIAIVAEKVVTEQSEDEAQTLEAKTKAAIEDYEISDPTDQRKLLIEVEAKTQAIEGTGSGGSRPDYP